MLRVVRGVVWRRAFARVVQPAHTRGILPETRADLSTGVFANVPRLFRLPGRCTEVAACEPCDNGEDCRGDVAFPVLPHSRVAGSMRNWRTTQRPCGPALTVLRSRVTLRCEFFHFNNVGGPFAEIILTMEAVSSLIAFLLGGLAVLLIEVTALAEFLAPFRSILNVLVNGPAGDG